VFVPWSEILPGLTMEYDPTSENICVRGDIACVDAVIREMKRRFKPLAKKCNHDVMFSFLYLRTTQEYRRAVEDPHFFSDNRFVNHEDAVFAKYYFRAYDNWHAGRKRKVPRAWRIAFRAADKKSVSGGGNILLGMNAHINRDLPFVLAGIGMTKPDGTSRKPDHDKVNRILNRVAEPALDEAARRFDPSIDDASIDGTTLDETALLQLVVSWREKAWRNAEQLVAAETARQRARVAERIEDGAAAEALMIRSANAYSPPLSSSARRDAYCARHWDDA
jgi:Family of unknown function (DUF5995)